MARLLHLWSQATPAYVNTPTDVPITVGTRFTTTETMYVTSLRWFRGGTLNEQTPVYIGLFDAVTNEAIRTQALQPDDKMPGWQDNFLVSPGLLIPAGSYLIAAHYAADTEYYKHDRSQDTTLAIPNMTVPDNPFQWTTDDWPNPPTTLEDGPTAYLDVTITPFFYEDQPITDRTLDEKLDQWLQPNVATQPAQFPGYIPQQLFLLQDRVVNIEDIVNTIAGSGTTNSDTVMEYLTTNLGTNEEWSASAHPKLVSWLAALLAVLADALTTLAFLHDLFPSGHTPTDHDASLAAHRAATEPDGETLPAFIEGEMEIVLTAITDQTNEITQILAHGNGTEDVATIVGESDWGNIFRFDVPADFYVIDITTTDLDATSEDVAGTQVWDHLGFCIPLTVDGLPEYGPRLAIGGQVIRTGRQMGGIILNGRRVLSGHVTAYQYQAP